MERRLTAILAADIVGYSRLMGANESGTVAALETLRSDFINPKIGELSSQNGLPRTCRG
jgi:adenylate cyclase